MLWKNKRLLLIGAFVFWAVFTLALLTWWVIFSFRQLESLKALNLATENEILKHQRMLTYEGITLYLCLIFGACALIYFVFKENKILHERKSFLSLFTHDLKTTISSLRLMLERLSSKVSDSKLKSELKEIQGVGTRLGQQLQNALQITYQNDNPLLMESLDFCTHLNYIRSLWPDVSFKISGEIFVKADASALRSICMNLIQNAVDHAHANEVVFEKIPMKGAFVGVVCKTPGGRKLPVDIDKFKNNLRAFQSVDGSGLGLKLTLAMMKKMGGEAVFQASDDGSLEVHLLFQGVS